MMSSKIPKNLEDINTNWFSKVLGENIVESTFKATITNDGTGYCSEMVRAEFQIGGGNFVRLIVKLLPKDADILKILMDGKFDQIEIFSYKILIPELIKEVPELKKYICELIYGEVQKDSYNSVLILEDMKPKGYYVAKTPNDLKIHQFNDGLNFLITLHVASRCLEKRLNSTIESAYKWFPKCFNRIESSGDEQEYPAIYLYFPNGIPKIYNVVARNQRVINDKNLLTSLRRIQDNTREIFRAIMNAGQRFPCLIHGDLWAHNILVNDVEGFPIKVIDWQMIGYTDPAYDLVMYLIFCTPMASLTVDGLLASAREYYKRYSELSEKHGHKIERTMDEFMNFFQTYGFAYVLTIVIRCPPFQSEPESEPKFHKIFDILVEFKVLDFILSLLDEE